MNINKKKNIYKKKIIKIFNIIKKKTNCNIQIYFQINKETNIKFKNKSVENIEFKNNLYIKIISILNKKKYIIICNNIKKKTIKNCIKYINNSKNYTSKDECNILPNKKKFTKKYKKNLGIYFKKDININDIINILKNIEYNSNNSIYKNIKSDGTSFTKNENIIIIYNDYKKIKSYISKSYLLINNIILNYKNIMEYEYIYIYKYNILDILIKYHNLSKKNIKKIIIKKKIKNIKSKKYSVILNNEISCEIFKYLSIAINGNNIYYRNSFLKNKLNKQILPNWINIIEDPFLYKGIGSKPFDDEGLNTKKYFVIKKGILKTWILNSYYSKKLNFKNTFNEGGIHNWIFKNNIKNISFKELINKMNTGLIIDKLLGQGININTGLYSKGIAGFWVENKKIKYYINEATISGNLKKLYKNIIYMSNDININSQIRTGSILIKNIIITGKK